MKTIDRFAHVLPVALLLAAGLVALAADNRAPQRPKAPAPGSAQPADASADGSAAAAAVPAPASDTTVPALRAPFAPPVKKSQTGKSVVVITNGDLERMFGKSRQKPQRSDGANANGTGSGDDAVLSALPADMNAAQPQAGRNPAEIQAEIARLEQKAKHIKNPYVTPVPVRPEERAAEQGMSAPQKLQATQQRIEQLKQDLKKQESPPRQQQN